MTQKKFYRKLFYIFLIFIAGLFLLNIEKPKENKNLSSFIPEVVYFPQEDVNYIAPQIQNFSEQPYYNSACANENILHAPTYSDINYVKYTKGMRTVNVLFNFINYSSNTSEHFTQEEITYIITTFKNDVYTYFERMSQGFVTIQMDYVCSTAPETYEYYKGLNDANSTLEQNIFNNAVAAKKDYNGQTKKFIFNNYNFRVNAFAGNSGNWSTFLWPHAYSSLDMILMMEYQQGISMRSSTVCHEMMHTFGVGDLYAYTGTSQAFSAQNLDMMGSSTKNLSTNAYYRNKVGWIESSSYEDNKVTPIEEIAKVYGDVSVKLYPNCTSQYGNKTIAYKFGEYATRGEYFMIEYRVKNYGGLFDPDIYTTGVIIYRVKPGAPGNRNGNSGGDCEVIFMGNRNNGVSSYQYTHSCFLTSGATFGNTDTGGLNRTSLAYSSGGGVNNLFNGPNSNIIVTVNSITDECATVTLSFADDRTEIDMKNVCWDYSGPFMYDGTEKVVRILNLPQMLTITRIGTYATRYAGTHIASFKYTYDETLYKLININFSTTLSWEIKPAEIKILIDHKTSKYGDTLVELTYSIESGTVYGSDNPGISLTKQPGTSVGTYAITATCTNKNYSATFTAGTYTITPRQIYVEVFDQTYNLTNFSQINQNSYQILEGSDSMLSGDSNVVKIVATGFDGNNFAVGTYSLTATSTNINYSIIPTNGTLTIQNTADLSNVKWDYSNAFNYNGQTKSIGLINVPNHINVTYEGIRSAKNAGNYSVSVSLTFAGAEITTINSTFSNTLEWEILPANIEIKIDNKSSKYGEKLQPLTYSVVSGKVFSGDDIGISLNKDEGNNVGTYAILASFNNPNYLVSAQSASYEITPRKVSIKLSNQSHDIKSFSAPSQTDYIILEDEDSVVVGDNLNISIIVSHKGDIKIGEYNLTAICDNPNYIVTFTPATLTITPEPSPLPIIFVIAIAAMGVFIICMLIYFPVMRRKRYSWKRKIDY